MTVRSAIRTLDLLELLAQQSRPLTLAELNRMIDLPKSSTLLLLRTLEARRYVVREADGYRLIRLPGEIASGERPAWGTLRRVAAATLTDAATASNESVFLAVLTASGMVRYLCKVLPPDRELKYDRNITLDRVPHHVASGLALLARLPDAAVEDYVRGISDEDPVPRETARSAIQLARRDGVAVNLAGRVEGAAGVAVAVCDAASCPVAAVNLAGPVSRVRAELTLLKQVAQEAATRIGAELARLAPRMASAR